MSYAEFRCRANELNFRRVFQKLTSDASGPHWDEDFAERAISYYKKFLFLCSRANSFDVRPNVVADTVWHAHLSDSEEYNRHCQKLFGFSITHQEDPSQQSACVHIDEIMEIEFGGKSLADFHKACEAISPTLLEAAFCVSPTIKVNGSGSS